jgi:ankyrin repeat protein
MAESGSVDGSVVVDLSLAISCGELATVEGIIKRNPTHVNVVIAAGGLTPVLLAARFGHFDILQCLIHAGGDLKAVSKDGDSALYLACDFNHFAAIKFLLSQKEVDINHCNGKAQSAFWIACYRGKNKNVRATRTTRARRGESR